MWSCLLPGAVMLSRHAVLIKSVWATFVNPLTVFHCAASQTVRSRTRVGVTVLFHTDLAT